MKNCSFVRPCWKPSPYSEVSSASAGFTLASKSSASQTMMWLEEVCSSSLIFLFGLELATQLVHLFTFRELLVFTYKVEMHFIHEGMELWTFFTSPKQLNSKFLSHANDELDNFSPVLILAKM